MIVMPWVTAAAAASLLLAACDDRSRASEPPPQARPGGPVGEGEGEAPPAEGGQGEGEGEPTPLQFGEGEGEGEGEPPTPVGGEGEGEGEGEPPPPPLECPPTLAVEPQACETVHPGAAEVTADIAGLPPSLQFAENCGPGGYESSNYRLPAALLAENGDVSHELHVIGIRDPAPGGKVEVRVEPTPLPVMLFLSAHSVTSWEIQPAPGARVCQVLTHGFEEQMVAGVPEEATVEHLFHPALCNRDWAWESPNPMADDFQWMMGALRKAVGIRETTFQGCYLGAKFTVPHLDAE